MHAEMVSGSLSQAEVTPSSILHVTTTVKYKTSPEDDASDSHLVAKVWFMIVQANIYAIRYWIEYVAVPFATYYNHGHIAADGKISNDGVRIVRNVQYGNLPGECMDILSPTQSPSLSKRESVIYIHGGGFVSVHRGVMNHSITPLVRAGFTVYSIDYPLAPEFKYPMPIISIIRCLAFIKARYGVDSVKIVADSAGGCLASMAVGAVCNPSKDWHPLVKEHLQPANLPVIAGVALLYSICDTESWLTAPSLSLYGHFQNAIISFCLSQYRTSRRDKISICDNLDKLDAYPPTLLLCGDMDPLQHSHTLFESHLIARKVRTTKLVMSGFHGFHGLPAPFSLGLWRTTVFPANCAIIKWLCNGSDHRVPILPPRSWAEYNFTLLIVLGLVHVLAVYAMSLVLDPAVWSPFSLP